MSVEAVLARISEIRTMTAPPAAKPAASSSSTSFADTLQQVGTSTLVTGAPASTPSGSVGQQMVARAAQEVGVAEAPPGSNDAPRIAEYRTATAGAAVGPWCAYFVSWLAKQSGAPLGEAGQGFANVDGISGWAQRTGRNLPAGSTPQAGDVIYWGGEHVGLVESVDADGSIHTIEGNSSNAVTRRTYGKDGGGASGYVRL